MIVCYFFASSVPVFCLSTAAFIGEIELIYSVTCKLLDNEF